MFTDPEGEMIEWSPIPQSEEKFPGKNHREGAFWKLKTVKYCVCVHVCVHVRVLGFSVLAGSL